MRRLLLKLILFLLPFLGVFALELWVLPIDFSTFRVWEALKVDSLKWALPGYFYPNMEVTKTEDGDLAPHTPLTVKKRVLWQTDRYGYRKAGNPSARYDIVIVGDSNTAGSSLTQKETLSEVLGEVLGVAVYPLAPASINTFLKDVRFMDFPPKIVVLATIEREITHLRQPKRELVRVGRLKKWLSGLELSIKAAPAVQVVAISVDRALRWNLLHYCRASLRRAVSGPSSAVSPAASAPSLAATGGTQWAASSGKGPMLFLQGVQANEPVTDDRIRQTVATISSYNALLKARGIRFVFLPIPNKENIYADHLPVKSKPDFLLRLIPALQASGVETIDAQAAFDEAYRTKGALLFHLDDSHWNREGVRLSANLVAGTIRHPLP
jgi:alginate O-acetyltransferase complex protein AlgJ